MICACSVSVTKNQNLIPIFLIRTNIGNRAGQPFLELQLPDVVANAPLPKDRPALFSVSTISGRRVPRGYLSSAILALRRLPRLGIARRMRGIPFLRTHTPE
jgi:hypothetical protein